MRFATLYGRNDPGNLGRLLKAITRRRFVLIGRGDNRKVLLHVDDAARAIVLALEQPAAPGASVFNVAGAAVPMRDIIDAVYRSAGRRAPRLWIPSRPFVFASAAISRVLGTRSKVARVRGALLIWLADESLDGSKFTTATGFRPEVSLAEGMRDAIQSHVSAKQ